jgi:hypothetical protein
MATADRPQASTTSAARLVLGARLIALAGVGLIGYGMLFLIRNFTDFIELGLTPELVGGTEETIYGFSPRLYEYISHLQVALSGFFIALGIAVIGLAWYGIRRGEWWALWTAFLSPVVAVAIALPLHFPYGLATYGHLGPIYLDAFVLLVGTVIAYTALPRSPEA